MSINLILALAAFFQPAPGPLPEPTCSGEIYGWNERWVFCASELGRDGMPVEGARLTACVVEHWTRYCIDDSGPEVTYPRACALLDHDEDGDVDLWDAVEEQRRQ